MTKQYVTMALKKPAGGYGPVVQAYSNKGDTDAASLCLQWMRDKFNIDIMALMELDFKFLFEQEPINDRRLFDQRRVDYLN